MTTETLPQSQLSSPTPVEAQPGRMGGRGIMPPSRKRGRLAVVAVLVASLVGAAGTRLVTDSLRYKDIPPVGETSSTTSLSAMNSFALGLLLGGLRGPLVMFLWTQSENQKSDKNLEGVDTQIEWIRLLQPEFDTVHIFQIWNKAYNLSVQMASLANKYSVILDALDYAHKVDQEKPDDINILMAVGQIYFDKLGNSQEKLYYRRRVRSETLPHPVSPHHPGDPGWRRTKLDPMLDEHFQVLPALTEPTPGHTARPKDLPANQEWNDGSELQYLKPQGSFLAAGFPDGLSPFALSYNYYKRSEVLQNTYHQHHAQLGDSVIDSRPALALKNWSDAESEWGRRREAQADGLAVPEAKENLDLLTANVPVDHPFTDRHAAELAEFAYGRAAELVPHARAEYLRHIANDPSGELLYRSHLMDLDASGEMEQADHDYIAAMLAPADQRAGLLASAQKHYQAAAYRYSLDVLTFYTDPSYLQKALPPGFGRFRSTAQPGIEDLTPTQAAIAMAIVSRLRGPRGFDSHDEDLQDYQRYFARIAVRLQMIGSQHAS